eukprot:scaffold202485_cov20-Tisochrysis_lutea.AAC.2
MEQTAVGSGAAPLAAKEGAQGREPAEQGPWAEDQTPQAQMAGAPSLTKGAWQSLRHPAVSPPQMMMPVALVSHLLVRQGRAPACRDGRCVH